MKALTIREPWASAIVHGNKRIENRTWAPPESVQGQRIAIHAAKAYGPAERQNANYLAQYEMFSFDASKTELGSIIGVATVAGTVWEDLGDGMCVVRCESFVDTQPSFGLDWFQGPIGWVLADVVALPTPVPAKGALGCWEVDHLLVNDIRVQLAELGDETEVKRWREEKGLSPCCGAPREVWPPDGDGGSTRFYRCTKCQEAA